MYAFEQTELLAGYNYVQAITVHKSERMKIKIIK